MVKGIRAYLRSWDVGVTRTYRKDARRGAIDSGHIVKSSLSARNADLVYPPTAQTIAAHSVRRPDRYDVEKN